MGLGVIQGYCDIGEIGQDFRIIRGTLVNQLYQRPGIIEAGSHILAEVIDLRAHIVIGILDVCILLCKASSHTDIEVIYLIYDSGGVVLDEICSIIDIRGDVDCGIELGLKPQEFVPHLLEIRIDCIVEEIDDVLNQPLVDI